MKPEFLPETLLYNVIGWNPAIDWQQYSYLRVGGCQLAEKDHVDWGIPRHKAHFFTIYAITHEGYTTAITDMPTFETALAVAEYFRKLSGLIVEITC